MDLIGPLDNYSHRVVAMPSRSVTTVRVGWKYDSLTQDNNLTENVRDAFAEQFVSRHMRGRG